MTRTETILLTDRGPVRVPLDLPVAALGVALSYVGGIMRWNAALRQVEIVNPFRGFRS